MSHGIAGQTLSPGRAHSMFARLLVLVLGVAVLVIAAVALGTYLWPDRSPVVVGHLAGLEPLEPQSVAVAGLWLVQYEDGTVIAFVDDSPHPRAGPLQWQTTDDLASPWIAELLDEMGSPGAFYEPRLGSMFAVSGQRVFGPAPRNLDRYPVEVSTSGVITVDTSRVIEGERGVTSGGHATPTPATPPPSR